MPTAIPPHPVRTLSCRVAEVATATHDTRILWLAIEAGGPLAYSAGQYVELAFPGQPGRDYSMASRPDQALLEFHVREEPRGTVSRYVVGRLAPGAAVEARGPHGDAWLREDHARPMLCVAGGSGLAPIKAIVETALHRGMTQDIHLYFGVRAERDVYLEDQLAALAAGHPNLHPNVVLSEPDRPSPRRTGLLGDAVLADFARFGGWKAYLAGPPAMVDGLGAHLLARGLGPRDLHADPFVTIAEKAARQIG